MAEINGGSVHFDVTANVDDAQKRINDLRSSISKLGETIESQDNEIVDLEKKLTDLGDAAAKAFMAGDDETYRANNKQIADIKKEIAAIKEEKAQAAELSDKYEEEAAAIEKTIAARQKETESEQKSSQAQMSIRGQMRLLREEMTNLELAGQKGTDQWNALAEKLGAIQDAYADTNRAMQTVASDTRSLDSIVEGVSFGTDAIEVATGAMGLFGVNTEDAAEMQTKLQSAMALANGVKSMQNALQKESNMMMGIGVIQDRAKAASQALATKNTVLATIAQRAFNVVANANPYVLLATALVTVVGAFAAFTLGSKKATKETEEATKATDDYADSLKQLQSDQRTELASMDAMLTIANDTTKSYGQRKNAIDELNKKYPALNASLKGEKGQLVINQKAYEQYRKSIENTARAKAWESQLQQSINKEMELSSRKAGLLNQKTELRKKADAYQLGIAYNGKAVSSREYEKALEQISIGGLIDQQVAAVDKELGVWQNRTKRISAHIANLTTSAVIPDTPSSTPGTSSSSSKEDIKKKKEEEKKKQEELEKARQEAIKESAKEEEKVRREIEIAKMKERDAEIANLEDSYNEEVARIDDAISQLKEEDKLTPEAEESYKREKELLEEKRDNDEQQLWGEWAKEDMEQELAHNVEVIQAKIDATKDGDKELLKLNQELLDAELEQEINTIQNRTDIDEDEKNNLINAAKQKNQNTKDKNVTDAEVQKYKRVSEYANQVAQSMQEVANVASNNTLAKIVQMFSKISGLSAKIAENLKFDEDGKKITGIDWEKLGPELLSTGIMTVVNWIQQAIINQVELNQKTEEWADALQLASYQLKDIYDNAFGTDDWTKVVDAAKNASDATDAYNNALAAANESGKWFSSNRWGFGWYEGTKLGTRSLKGGGMLQNVMPELFNADGSVNTDYIETALDTWGDKMDEETKQMLQNILDLKNAAEDNADEVESYISSVFGSLGDAAMESIVNAIKTGARSWDEFRDAGKDAIEELGEDLMYSLFLSSKFSAFQNRLTQIIGNADLTQEEKNKQMFDEMEFFFDYMDDWMGDAMNFGKEFQAEARQHGFDIWSDTSADTAQGAISSVTEQTASLIYGQMNAIRMNQVDANNVLRSQLQMLSGIKSDTVFLRSIDSRLAHIEGNNNYQIRMNA